jgi:hypothetical protein
LYKRTSYESYLASEVEEILGGEILVFAAAGVHFARFLRHDGGLGVSVVVEMC